MLSLCRFDKFFDLDYLHSLYKFYILIYFHNILILIFFSLKFVIIWHLLLDFNILDFSFGFDFFLFFFWSALIQFLLFFLQFLIYFDVQ